MAQPKKEMTLLEHLEELRRVLLICIIAVGICAVGAYVFNDRIMEVLLSPLTAVGYRPVVTGITEAFMVRIKLALFVGFLAALPVILWQVWWFVAPALEKAEQRYFLLFVFGTFFLFLAGVVFGFFGVFRVAVAFLLKFTGSQLVPMLTIDKYISFAIYLLLPFGLIFELPLVSFVVARLGLISSAFLARKRRYALLISVIVAAAITPTPDMITCLIMTAPLYALYEVSLVVVKLTERAKARKRTHEEAGEEEHGQGVLPASNS